MGKEVGKNQTDLALPRDWFVGAVEADGSVDQCLEKVFHELDVKSRFIACLRGQLKPTAQASDRVTEIGQRLKAFDNTLRFRLSVLSPDRRGAWFRPPATSYGGPFTTGIIAEPVFAPYQETDISKVRKGIHTAWEKADPEKLPFLDRSACLWRSLLVIAQELRQVDQLPPPFENLRFTDLPELLPVALESRVLRAFLLNVRGEIAALQQKLKESFEQLLAACERFWAVQEVSQQAKAKTLGASAKAKANKWTDEASRTREELKKRRSRIPVIKTSSDLEALKYMGFEDYPSPEDLKVRYLSLAKKWHPDREGGSEQRFKMLTRSYQHLVRVCLR